MMIINFGKCVVCALYGVVLEVKEGGKSAFIGGEKCIHFFGMTVKVATLL